MTRIHFPKRRGLLDNSFYGLLPIGMGLVKVGKSPAALLLVLLGVWQMAADTAEMPRLKGVALATCASPAPKVFSAVKGFETYSTQFSIAYRDASGATQSLSLTPELTQHIQGPYNRRNVFGAAIAYAPILAESAAMRPLFESVVNAAFCDPAQLKRELGINDSDGPFEIRLSPQPGTNLGKLQTAFVVECK